MASQLLQWKLARDAAHRADGATLIWRTRGYDHYGALGWSGTLERRACAPVSEPQRLSVEGDLRRARSVGLNAAGVHLLDAGPASAPRHDAHPHVSQRGNAAFWDCRHWCQPGGPPDAWNRELVRLMESKT